MLNLIQGKVCGGVTAADLYNVSCDSDDELF